jgi:Flp pilus assembly pilin Flp
MINTTCNTNPTISTTTTQSSLPAKLARRRRRGQGMTEYIICVGLIAILLVGAVTAFKDALSNSYSSATNEIDTSITAEIQAGGGGAGATGDAAGPASFGRALGAAEGGVDNP